MSAMSTNDRIKSVVVGLEAEIPEVGGVVAVLTDLFWPESGEDIWDSIKAQVASLVDDAILAKELEERKEVLDGLRDTMKSYVAAKDHEKGAIMAAMLTSANILYSELTESSNAIHLIPVAVAAANIHLTLLRERLNHGREIYQEENGIVWRNELGDRYLKCSQYFRDIYPKWAEWNAARYPGDANTDGNDAWQRNEAIGGMTATLEPTFLLIRFLPEHPHDGPRVDPQLAEVWLGPYSVACWELGASDHAIETVDNPGIINQVYVREFNSVDGLQFIYTTHEGNFTGNPRGGAEHRIAVGPSQHITNVATMWSQGLMTAINIGLSDGSGSGWLGNRGGWPGATVAAAVSPDYVLVGSASGRGWGPSGTSGTGIIKLQFMHRSMLPWIVKQEELEEAENLKQEELERASKMRAFGFMYGLDRSTSTQVLLEVGDAHVGVTRNSMPEDEGMFFEPIPHGSNWHNNAEFPVDLIWVSFLSSSSPSYVLDIERDISPNYAGIHYSDGHKGLIVVNAGFAERHGIRTGFSFFHLLGKP